MRWAGSGRVRCWGGHATSTRGNQSERAPNIGHRHPNRHRATMREKRKKEREKEKAAARGIRTAATNRIIGPLALSGPPTKLLRNGPAPKRNTTMTLR
ncbi:hypothetical protein HPB50_015760 [Hyalomma asiaticum]|uniref:Uncharacterized protein n=1 Tax=Hyalomma asiaticum TaxID=266040 RepID=A0ACB7SVW7_HYAAI|nr:hypothetical protein HPB50_015760 [Hyalomma asiaticum]